MSHVTDGLRPQYTPFLFSVFVGWSNSSSTFPATVHKVGTSSNLCNFPKETISLHAAILQT